MTRATSFIMGISIVALSAMPVLADTATFQARQDDPFITGETFQGTEETHLRSSQPDNNFGTMSQLSVGYSSSQDSYYRALLRMAIEDSFAALLAENPGMDVEVTSATISVYVDGISGTQTLSLYAIGAEDGDWVEGSTDYNTEEGATCWNYKSYSSTDAEEWSFGAGLGQGTDTDATDSLELIGSVEVSSTGLVTFTLSAELVQSWLSDDTNYGILIVASGEDNADNYLTIRSSDHNWGTPPKLTVEYDLVEVPEPATLGLVSLGSMLLLRRRRN